jgi:endonuclease YncB( thermonuclease family)
MSIKLLIPDGPAALKHRSVPTAAASRALAFRAATVSLDAQEVVPARSAHPGARCGAFSLGAVRPAGAGGDPALTGRASIVDADTFDIRDTRIRLHAIDAPESSQLCFVAGDAQRCGQRAALAHADWIAQRIVSCIERDIDRYGRTIATCTVGGDDIGRWLVRNGHAVAYRRYGDDYVCDEAIAAMTRRGIWATDFVEPSAWRQLPDEARDEPPIGRYDPGWPAGC